MKRILFVDDEANVLHGLERMLHGLRKEMEMTFVTTGDAALEEMARSDFDVIVSDMKMPGMDGATLLARVQKDHPGTVRIILSGHTEMEMAMRSIHVAHYFLGKPCDALQLREVVSRTCGLQDLLNCPDLRKKVCGLDSLPPAPRVYCALTAALARADVTAPELARIVEQDPALCAKLLQLVNSSFLALPRRIADAQHAISFLGVRMLSNLVLTVEVFGQFQSSRLPERFSFEKEQQHASLTTRIARDILDGNKATEDVTAAAMLHDTGRLVLACCMPDLYQQIMAEIPADGTSNCALEERIVGVNHAHIGAYLLGIWGLPHPIVEAVAFHHSPSKVENSGFDLLGAVHVASFLAAERVDPNTTQELDERYLDDVGVHQHLPAWRELAERCAGELEIPERVSSSKEATPPVTSGEIRQP